MDLVTREILSLEYTEEQIDAMAALNAKLLLSDNGWTHEQIDDAMSQLVNDILFKEEQTDDGMIKFF